MSTDRLLCNLLDFLVIEDLKDIKHKVKFSIEAVSIVTSLVTYQICYKIKLFNSCCLFLIGMYCFFTTRNH